jgi:lipopolysaccharide/colanic/teichoic acid biosynthesis glycosyltransferase
MDFIDKQVTNREKKFPVLSERPKISFLMKRLFDVIGSCIGLFLIWPFLLFFAIRLKIDSPGPAYYQGPRSGKNGRIFQIYKFRTMYECPESYAGAQVTSQDDNRITKYGAWLRDTKINELPQLWNILKGDMSFVGPRPEHPDIVAQWSEEVQREILSVRPGITSPASVTYRNEEKLLSSTNVMDDYLQTILPDKLRLDLLYVRHFSVIGDLDVIFMTLTMLLPVLRKKQLPENSLFDGPLKWFVGKFVSWFLVDTVIAFMAISLIVLIWRVQAPFDIGFGRMFLTSACLSLGMSLTNTLFGLKRITWRYASPLHVVDLALSTIVAIVMFSVVAMVYTDLQLPIPLLVEFGLFSFIGFVAIRYRERLITGLASRWIRWRGQSNNIGERVLIIGAGDCGQLAIWLLEKSNLSSVFSIVGLVDDDYSKLNQRINGYQVLGTIHDLPEIISKKSIGLVMFAINKITEKEKKRILKSCQNLPVRILMIPDLLQVVSNYFIQQAKEAKQFDEG